MKKFRNIWVVKDWKKLGCKRIKVGCKRLDAAGLYMIRRNWVLKS